MTVDLGTPLSDSMKALGAKLDLPAGAPPPSEVRTELVPYPHPALLKIARPCTEDMWDVPDDGDSHVQQLADALSLVRQQLAAMKVDSYGVAAPQIALPFRAFVWDNNGSAMALFNPEIIEQSLERDVADEECLSFLGKFYRAANRFDPGLSVQVERPARVVVRGFTVKKECVEVEATGWLARMMQHEIDHLDGLTMLDRLATRQMKRDALRRWYKMHPELQTPKSKGKR